MLRYSSLSWHLMMEYIPIASKALPVIRGCVAINYFIDCIKEWDET